MSLNVVAFPQRDKITNTSQEAREYADRVEGEDASALLIHWGDNLRMELWGEGLDVHQILGLIEVAKAFVLKELLNGDGE